MKEYITILTPIVLGVLTLLSAALSWRYKASRADLAKMMRKEEERDSKIEAEFIKVRQENESLRKELEEREKVEIDNLRAEFGEIKTVNNRLRRDLDDMVIKLKLCEDSRIALLKKLAAGRIEREKSD